MDKKIAIRGFANERHQRMLIKLFRHFGAKNNFYKFKGSDVTAYYFLSIGKAYNENNKIENTLIINCIECDQAKKKLAGKGYIFIDTPKELATYRINLFTYELRHFLAFQLAYQFRIFSKDYE